MTEPVAVVNLAPLEGMPTQRREHEVSTVGPADAVAETGYLDVTAAPGQHLRPRLTEVELLAPGERRVVTYDVFGSPVAEEPRDASSAAASSATAAWGSCG